VKILHVSFQINCVLVLDTYSISRLIITSIILRISLLHNCLRRLILRHYQNQKHHPYSSEKIVFIFFEGTSCFCWPTRFPRYCFLFYQCKQPRHPLRGMRYITPIGNERKVTSSPLSLYLMSEKNRAQWIERNWLRRKLRCDYLYNEYKWSLFEGRYRRGGKGKNIDLEIVDN